MFYATIFHILSELFCIASHFFEMVIVIDLFWNCTNYLESPGRIYLHLAVLLAKEFSEKMPPNEDFYMNTLKQKLYSEIGLLVAVAMYSIRARYILFE